MMSRLPITLANAAARGAAAIAGACLMLMMLQTVLDVALKYFLNAPIEGNLEIVSYYYMVAVVFLPFALVELKHEHINVDLFIGRLPRLQQNRIYVAASFLGMMFFTMLFYQTLLDAIHATRIDEIIMGSTLLAVWPAKWALPVSFAAMLLALGANILRALGNMREYEPRPEAPEVG